MGGLLGKPVESEPEGEEPDVFAGGFGGIQVAEHRPAEEDLPFEEGDFCVEILP